MTIRHKTPFDLACAVNRELKASKKSIPLQILSELFKTLYYASLKTEECQSISSYVIYIDPDNPDPDPPGRIVKDRWSCIKLEEVLPFSVSALVKIAKASDPRTSSLAVFHDHNNQLFIWGLVDQGNRYHDFVNFESESGPERPGLFQANIVGIGHLAAYRGYDRIAELNVNTLVTETHDILRYGPVSKLIQKGINDYISTVARELDDEHLDSLHNLKKSLSSDWVATLCRILLRIKNFRHGGALLITPDDSAAGLGLKYKLAYSRLRSALIHRGVHKTILDSVETDIYDILEDDDSEDLPIIFHLDESIATDEIQDSNSELDGAVWFVSLLTRVDGLVLLDFNLNVKAFGVEILNDTPPPNVFRATTASATSRSLIAADYQHFGTRHRSMMRYCYYMPGSLGFVVSQDGDVRVMTRIDDALVYWDSIRLQYDEFIKQRRKREEMERMRRILAQQNTKSEPIVQ